MRYLPFFPLISCNSFFTFLHKILPSKLSPPKWRRKAEKSRMHRLVYFLFAVQIMWFLAVHPSCMFFLVTCCFSSNELWLVLSTGIGFNFQWCPKEWKILNLTTQSWKKLFCVKFVLKYKILTQENLSSKLNWFKLLCVS